MRSKYREALMAEVARSLELDPAAAGSRHFVVSVSGGLDSSVLLWIMNQLRADYGFSLSALHLNFQLRGEDSNADEKFVRQICEDWNIPLVVRRWKTKSQTGIQEKARDFRLKNIDRLFPDAEYLEAHHADDQIETFLFRIFRGTGLRGLKSIKPTSLRGERRVWRPLLGIPKRRLREFAQSEGLRFREDHTNLTDIYDRNWIRLRLIPLIESRFPSFQNSILRLIEQIVEEEQEFDRAQESWETNILLNSEDLTVWNWEKIRALTPSDLHRFVHSFFWKHFQITLSRRQVLELSLHLESGKSFVWNAPKGLVIRGRKKSRTCREDQIALQKTATAQRK